ncbi:IS1634 family transposase [candidate division KSB3 bacterium]|nr:IS1634 family transposase [candidate division KSB3 bacterium]
MIIKYLTYRMYCVKYVVHNIIWSYVMHLSYKTRKYKNKVYKSFFLAESYREGNKVKKRNLCPLGSLTEIQQRQIQLICKTVSNPSYLPTTLEDIVVLDSQSYLPLAVANALWEEWRLSQAFGPHITESPLSTPLIARVLTLNRCVAPCSHYSIPDWIQHNAVSEVIDAPLESLNDDKIYYELDKIDQSQDDLEQHLFQLTSRHDPTSYQFVNYDLSSSYFIGSTCPLARYGKSKDHKPQHKQVLLGLLVNKTGYPFKWHVYPGNTPEVETLIANVNACQTRFHLTNMTLVFDRGIVSDDNLTAIRDAGLKYLSALDKDQIATIPGLDLSGFADLSHENFNERLRQQGFVKYDDALYAKDLGVLGSHRYILGFNPKLWQEERTTRQEKLASFDAFVAQKNAELSQAQRSRKPEPTQRAVLDKLRSLKIRKYFQEPILRKITIPRTRKNGTVVSIHSFQIAVPPNTPNLAKSQLLDGLCVFLSNHCQTTGSQFRIPFDMLIRTYREKSAIEDAFKHLKSFVHLRPFYVYRDEHVRAVYTICVLGYVLNKDLAERRKKLEGVDYLNSKNLYAPFRNGHYVTLKDLRSGQQKKQAVELTSTQERLLHGLNITIPHMNSKSSCRM